MATLTLRNVSKIYPGNVRAVSGVNADIADGEFIILVGPSGCGKSTLLRMIAGLEEISEGEVAIDGRVVNEIHAKDRDIAFVFQNYALYPHMTVAENMAFGLRLRKFPKEEIAHRIRDAAEILGLTQYLDRKPKALSGGQRQRVAVGRAIVRQPRLFLFDEPLSNLDAKMRVTMRAELIKLHNRLNATMVYVTHDQVEAMSMGDRLVVMKDGVVQQIGSPLEIYDRPANRFVAGFIGSPPMNFLPCEIERRGEEWWAVGEGLNLPLPPSRRESLAASFRSGDARAVLGIRPEDIHETNGDARAVNARVEILEQLGGEVIATASLGATEIVARLAARTAARANAPIALRFDLERARLFHPETGMALI
jgi:multiple sugar transport system ATP-binding protein